MDMDTMLGKLDSRIVDDVIVVKGPYSSRYGPGFDFIDVQLLTSPRYANGFETHGSSSVDYKTNGEPWYGRQSFWGGDDQSGFRVGYGHRIGNDYAAGDGTDIPASDKSRDLDFNYGVDLSDASHLEFSYLRLDQTDVEFPGQAFDIDYLVTDAYELVYVQESSSYYDRLMAEGWYNRTRFDGSAQRPGKRRQFPRLDDYEFNGFTDVDSMSTGYQLAVSWGEETQPELTLGTDLRYVKQELNEFTSGENAFTIWSNRNSPIPRSHQSNPGLFVEYVKSVDRDIVVTSGARVDWVSSNIDDREEKLMDLGIRDNRFHEPLSLGQILGSDQFDQDQALWSLFSVGELRLTDSTSLQLAAGYAERAPTLTELYAAQPFMFLLQNGLTSVTGDPTLTKERTWQIDAGLDYDNGGPLRVGLSGFHAWVHDYITFENMEYLDFRSEDPMALTTYQPGVNFYAGATWTF